MDSLAFAEAAEHSRTKLDQDQEQHKQLAAVPLAREFAAEAVVVEPLVQEFEAYVV